MSQSVSRTKEIDGHTYEVYFLPPRAANRVFLRTVKTAVPGLTHMLDSMGDVASVLDAHIAEAGVGPAIRDLVDRLDEDVLWETVEAMAGVTTVQGEGKLPSLLSTHFAGRLGSMYKWLAFAYEVNFQDFFDALAPTLSAAAARMQAAQESKSDPKAEKAPT